MASAGDNIGGNKFLQDWLPATHAHGEGGDDVGRDLDEADQSRVHVGTAGQVQLLVNLRFFFF